LGGIAWHTSGLMVWVGLQNNDTKHWIRKRIMVSNLQALGIV
jgi:hypothetical protein